MASRIVPLFPLNTVLFPGMVLPLHIFEPRYRLMVQRCMEGQQLFGVVLIQEGDEVGEEAVPHAMGTLAAIQHAQAYEDGRMDLLTVGVSRFRILDELPGESYAQARVELLDESDEAPDVTEVVALFETYLQTLSLLSNQDYALTIVPDPQQLSYQIAAVLPLELEEKQLLLEAPGTSDRLAVEADLLRRETEQIRAFLAKTQDLGYFYFRGKRLSSN